MKDDRVSRPPSVFGGCAVMPDGAPALGDEVRSFRRHGDDGSCAGPMAALDEAAFDRLLPDREPGAGRAPRLHHLSVRPRIGADPFQKVENEGVEPVGHALPPARGYVY